MKKNKNEVERYDFGRKPKRVSRILMWVAKSFVIKYRMRGLDSHVERINMEGLKPPYLLLATHASEMDFCMEYLAIEPYRYVHNVVAIDAVRDMGDGLMRSLGSITKRKFVRDYDLIRNLRYCAKNMDDIICMYPEARYSLDGTASYIPPSTGKLCKLLNIPVVVLNMQGTFIIGPQWNKTRQPCPQRARIEQVVTKEQLKELSAEQINKIIHEKFERDDFKYQYDNKIENNYPERAHGLHSILYQCPNCNTEFEMHSEGTRLWCEHCGKAWQMTPMGRLVAETGKTEFEHIPDWFKWEREHVKKEVRSGAYRFDCEVDVHTLPNAKAFEHHGKGRLVQTVEGTTLDCNAYGKPTHVEWKAADLESVHVEYDYPFFKKHHKKHLLGDCVDISVTDDSYWLHPSTLRDQLTKLSFATEEIHFLALEKLHSD